MLFNNEVHNIIYIHYTRYTLVMNQFSNLWAIIHPPLSTEQGV